MDIWEALKAQKPPTTPQVNRIARPQLPQRSSSSLGLSMSAEEQQLQRYFKFKFKLKQEIASVIIPYKKKGGNIIKLIEGISWFCSALRLTLCSGVNLICYLFCLN